MSGLNLVVLRAQSPSEAWLAQARFKKHSRFLGSVTASGSVRAKHTTHCWKKENPGGEKWSQAKPIKKRWVTGTRIQKTTMCCDRHRQHSSGGTSTARCRGGDQSLTCSPTRMAPEST